MLQTIRDKSQGLIASVILVLVCITFALWGIHNYFNGAAELKPVAKINGDKITQQQFDAAFNRFRQQQIQQNPELLNSQVAIDAAKRQLLDSLVTASVLTQAANKSGFAVGQSLIELEIANMPAFQVNGSFSKSRFEQILNQMMYTQQQFIEALTNSMLLAQVRAGFISTGTVLPYQVDESIRLINQKRTFAYVIIPASHFKQSNTISEQAIQQYYQSHQKEFTLPAEISLHYLSLSVPDLMKKIKPTEADLMQYYQNNINHYTTPAGAKPYTDVKNKVMDDYLKETAEKQFASRSDQLANAAFEHPNSLEPAAKELDLTVQTTGLFNQSGGNDLLTKNPKLITAGFSNEVMNQANNSDLVQLADDQVIVVRINQKVPARVKPLQEVKQTIIDALKQQAAANQSKLIANKILQGLSAHQSLSQLAAENGFTVQEKQLASRNNNSGVSQNLVVAAFNLGLPTKQAISAMVLPLTQGDSAVVQLLSVQNSDPRNVADNTKHFYDLGMARSAGILDYSLYVDGLKRDAKIKYY